MSKIILSIHVAAKSAFAVILPWLTVWTAEYIHQLKQLVAGVFG
jgi:hypothetical protein